MQKGCGGGGSAGRCPLSLSTFFFETLTLTEPRVLFLCSRHPSSCPGAASTGGMHYCTTAPRLNALWRHERTTQAPHPLSHLPAPRICALSIRESSKPCTEASFCNPSNWDEEVGAGDRESKDVHLLHSNFEAGLSYTSCHPSTPQKAKGM